MFVRSSIVLVSSQDLSYITTRVFVQLLVITKYYNRDINRAENGELMCLFEQSTFALEECYRTISVILDRLDLDLSSPHDGDAPSLRKIVMFYVLIQFLSRILETKTE